MLQGLGCYACKKKKKITWTSDFKECLQGSLAHFGCSMTYAPVSFMNFNGPFTYQKYWQGESIRTEKFMDSDWVEGVRCGALVSGAEWQDSIRDNMFLKLGGDHWRSDAVRISSILKELSTSA